MDLEDDDDRFVREVVESGLVYALESEEGFALVDAEPDDGDADADGAGDGDAGIEEAGAEDAAAPTEEASSGRQTMPFWSQRAEAERAAADGFAVVELPLRAFLDEWLIGMHEDGLRVGVNFDPELVGIEMEPLQLAREILDALGEL